MSEPEWSLPMNRAELIARVEALEAALRKYGYTLHTGNNKQCNCCHYFGMEAHKEGCEIGRLLTATETPAEQYVVLKCPDCCCHYLKGQDHFSVCPDRQSDRGKEHG